MSSTNGYAPSERFRSKLAGNAGFSLIGAPETMTEPSQAVPGRGGTAAYPNRSILLSLLILAFLTSSFDIFLGVKIYGTQVRISQLLELAFLFGALTTTSYVKKPSWPVGFGYALIWCMFVLMWTPNTYDIGFSIGYSLWLIMSLLKIFFMCQLLRDKISILMIYRAYVFTFVLISIFGLIQFVAGRFGVSLLVTQWWFAGFPRVNGFSYEPSYYATYLISGWGMCVYLIEKTNTIFSRRWNIINFSLVSIALVISTSRMGLLMVGVYGGFYIIRKIYRMIVKPEITQSGLRMFILSIFVVGPVLLYLLVTVNFKNWMFLLSGTGIAGSADHSSNIRLGQFWDTIDLFLKSPVIGYGMGGIGSYLGRAYALAPNEATGMNVTAEVLASSGILGFPFFVLFMWSVLIKPFSSRFVPGEMTDALRSAAVGMALLFIILQFNQSILRLYVWNHIAVVCVLYAGCMRFSRGGRRMNLVNQLLRPGQSRSSSRLSLRSTSIANINRGSGI
jgi:uncharacterized protein YneF (UPF0154 family)